MRSTRQGVSVAIPCGPSVLYSFSGNWWKKTEPLAYNKPNEKGRDYMKRKRRMRRCGESRTERSRRRIHSAVPFPKPPVVPETEQTVYIAMRFAHYSNTEAPVFTLRKRDSRALPLCYPFDSTSGPRSWLKWHVTFSREREKARPVSSVLRKSTPFHSILFSLCPYNSRSLSFSPHTSFLSCKY